MHLVAISGAGTIVKMSPFDAIVVTPMSPWDSLRSFVKSMPSFTVSLHGHERPTAAEEQLLAVGRPPRRVALIRIPGRVARSGNQQRIDVVHTCDVESYASQKRFSETTAKLMDTIYLIGGADSPSYR